MPSLLKLLCLASCWLAAMVLMPAPVAAAELRIQNALPAEYRSQHFFLHTDIGAEAARELLEKLETMLGLISDYWGRPPSGMIHCYVVSDLANWPADALDADGRAKIASGNGVTIQTLWSEKGRPTVATATVYATADPGVVQHEAVHAYCHMAFGRTGPVWYSEGMAEMGQYWVKGSQAVNCPPGVVQYLRSAPLKSLNEIVNGEQITGDSSEAYAWRWALCHLLATNTNYAARFRPLGLGLLNNQRVSFESVYGDQRKQIMFEYQFFIEHLERGYRVDLCSWDWKRKARFPKGKAVLSSTIQAARGWQAAGVKLLADSQYEYTSEGTWSISPDDGTYDANGNQEAADNATDGASDGRPGQLMAVIMQDFKLGAPFALGSSGTFTAPSNGTLYLRCHDTWHELADNQGQIKVKIKAVK